MGTKYEINILTNEENTLLLKKTVKVLYKHGWLYNFYKKGRYSYWVNNPIWEFGESIEVFEEKVCKIKCYEYINNIIENTKPFYSQNFILHKIINTKPSIAIVSIVESTESRGWKELSVSFEIEDVIRVFKLREQKNEYKDMFIELTKTIVPFYAIGSIEAYGLVEDPSKLIFNRKMLGELNYFSNSISNYKEIDKLRQDYDLINNENKGIFIFTV